MATRRARALICALIATALLGSCGGKMATKKYGKDRRARELTTVNAGERDQGSTCPGAVGALEARGLVSMDYCTLEASCDAETAKDQACLAHYARACRRCKSCGAGQMCDAHHTQVGAGLQVHCLPDPEGGACGSTGSGKMINRCSCYGEVVDETAAPLIECACDCRS